MGRGFYVKLGYTDNRTVATGYKLVKTFSYGDWLHPFNPPDVILNGTRSDNIYCEFDEGHNSSGDAYYHVIDTAGKEIASLYFKFRQEVVCCQSNKYYTLVQFNCPTEDYAFFFDTQKYIPGAYPHTERKITGCPVDSDTICIDVFYMGDAPLSPSLNSWLTSHNAFANAAEGWIYYQQYETFKAQLQAGIRTFMLDTHIDYKDDVVLAHGGATILHNLMKFGTFVKLEEYLDIIAKFLNDNKFETIFLFLEDYVEDPRLKNIFQQEKYLNYLYGIEVTEKDQNNNIARTHWAYPRLKDKTEDLKGLEGKMIVFTDVNENWLPYTYDYCIETVYEETINENFSKSCVQRPESLATNATVNNYPFFILNQFPTIDCVLLPELILEASPLLIAIGFALPGFGLIAGLAVLSSAIAELFVRSRIEAINSADLLIRKINWVKQGPDVSVGKYSRIPNFIALDFVLTGNAINAVGFATTESLEKYKIDHAKLEPSIILLAEYLVADQSNISAYLRRKTDQKTEKLNIVIKETLKFVELTELVENNKNIEYEVHLVYGDTNSDIYIGDAKIEKINPENSIKSEAWYFEYKRKYIDYEPYLLDVSPDIPVTAYMNGLFTRWVDCETGEIKNSESPQLVDCKLQIINNVKGIDVNFIDIVGVEGSNLYKIYVKAENNKPVLCATCYNKTIGLHALATANNVTKLGSYRSRKKSEIPQGYFLDLMANSAIGRAQLARFRTKMKETENKVLIALPSVTSLYSFEKGKMYPTSRIHKIFVRPSGNEKIICDLEFSLVDIQFNLELFDVDTSYDVIAQRMDNTEITLADFSLMKEGNSDKTIFATFKYLEAEV